MNPVRLSALAILATSAIMLVLDIIERIFATNWNGMALGYLWGVMAPGSLQASEHFIETHISLQLWQQILIPLLMLPIWVFFLVIGGLLLVFGKRLDD